MSQRPPTGEDSAQPQPPLRDIPMNEELKFKLLREVFTQPLQDEIARLNARLERLEKLVGEEQSVVGLVAGALPQAMQQAHMPRTRDMLETAMGDPWIGAASYAAEHKLDPATQALAPIMLPAISQAVKERLNALSRAMDRASPTRRIGWKMKSLQTGLPLETVMEQELDPFRVHRILAVEMPAGSLLATYRVRDNDDVATTSTPAQEEEEAFATAALLTALRGFARDAALGNAAGELSSVEIGKRTLHIAQQGSLMVAVEASGALAHDLESSIHGDLFPALRACKTQAEREQTLANWRGERAPAPKPRGVSPFVTGAAVAALVFGGLWYARSSIEQTDIERTLTRLQNLPGVATATAKRTAKGWQILLAADPTADIDAVLDDGLLGRKRIKLTYDPILSLDPISTVRAIERDLPLPARVRLLVSNGQVRIEGGAPREYIEAVKAHPRVRVANLAVVTH